MAEEGIKEAVAGTRTTGGGKDSSLVGKAGPEGKMGGTRICSKTSSINPEDNQDVEASEGCSRPRSNKTLTRTRGCPTCLRTRTRCRSSRIARAVPRVRECQPTNLISIPTKM